MWWSKLKQCKAPQTRPQKVLAIVAGTALAATPVETVKLGVQSRSRDFWTKETGEGVFEIMTHLFLLGFGGLCGIASYKIWKNRGHSKSLCRASLRGAGLFSIAFAGVSCIHMSGRMMYRNYKYKY